MRFLSNPLQGFAAFCTFFVLLGLVSSPTIHAEELDEEKLLEIEGRILNSQTGGPVEFANIGVKGTFFGTASNEDGYFLLKIPQEQLNAEIQISAVGYQTVHTSGQKLRKQKYTIIEMTPVRYGLGPIDIEAQNRILYGIVKKAAGAIPQLYIQGPFNYNLYYKSVITSSQPQKKEMYVIMHDQKGYHQASFAEAFKERNYLIAESRRSAANTPFRKGITNLDDLLSFDILRSRGNILDEDHLDQYDLKLVKKTTEGQDSVWVIHYKLDQPDRSSTGDAFIKAYQGEIFINKTNHAVVKNTIRASSSAISSQGRNIKGDSKSVVGKEVTYEVTTTYRNTPKGYIMAMVQMTRSYKDTKGNPITTKDELIVTEVKTKKIKKIATRNYYDYKPENKSFWEDFTIQPTF